MSRPRLSHSLLPLLLLSLVLLLALLPAVRGCTQNVCVSGYTYALVPGFNFSTNGCGSYGVSVDAPFGADPCCAAHDFCYNYCNSTKAQCDSTLEQCMQTQCQNDTGVDRDACKAQAVLFYNAVLDLGCPAYTDSQDQSCECTNGTATYLFGNGDAPMGRPSLGALVTLLGLLIAASMGAS